jgi:ABC-type nitrate/sulfonate/bicarbonate transport system substrate-binding protein
MHGRQRVRALIIAAASVLAAASTLLAGCGSSGNSSGSSSALVSSSSPQTLTIAVTSDEVTPIPNGIIQLGVLNGAFKKYHLTVNLVSLQGTPQTAQALVSGRADVANLDTSDAIDLEATHLADIRAFVSNGDAPDYVVVARDSVKNFSQVKGTTFANETPGSEPDLMMKLLLQQHHLKASSISEVSLGAPGPRLLAVVEGKADTTIVSDSQWTSLTAAQASCCHLLYNEQEFLKAVPVEATLDVASVSTLKTKKQALLDFIEAVLYMSREYYKNPALWASQVAKNRTDLVASTLAAHAKTAGFKDQFCINGCMNSSVLSSTSDFFYNSSALTGVKKIKLSTWTDTTLLKEVLAQMGVAKGTDTP